MGSPRSSANTASIEKVDLESATARQEIIAFLTPYETHNLFIIGNLQNNYPESHLYVAREDGKLVGVCGYYARPKSLIPFSSDRRIVWRLVRHGALIHPEIHYVNGIGSVGRHAFWAMRGLGYRPKADPRMVFMECRLEQGLPEVPNQALARLARDEDRHQLVRLLRYLQGPDNDSPVTDEQARKLSLRDRFVIEVNGKVLSTAVTNGLGLTAFQLLGVVTHPDYRGKGYATAVCAALIREFIARGAQACTLFTRPSNASAIAAYSRLGFAVTGKYYMAEFEDKPSASGLT